MKELICINCPVGCRLSVEECNGELKVGGQGCARGTEYAKNEITDPRRMVTCLVRVKGADMPLSVKTEKAVPKHLIEECIKEIKSLELAAPIKIGSVILEDIAGTGINAIATKSV